MISKCSECGRSYPTHHGSMCKLCATKKIRENEISKLQEIPQIDLPEKIEKIEEEIPVLVDSSISNEIDMTSLKSGSNISESKKNSEEEEIEGLLKVCPDCNYVNTNNDIFCNKCRKLLLTSQLAVKSKDYPIENIKGIFPEQITKLKKVGLDTSLQLINQAYNLSKRKLLAIKTGIPEILIYRLVNQADLLRVDGIEPVDAYILELIGLNTMRGLEKKTHHDILKAINTKKSILYSKKIIILPEEKKVKKWVDQFKSIEKLISQ